MALVVATLMNELLSVFSGESSSGAIASKKIANAYDIYAKSAMAGVAMPLFTGSEKTLFEQTLAPSLASSSGSPAVVGMAFQNALMAYWMTPPVKFSAGAMAGMVSAITGIAAVGTAISGLLSVPNEAIVAAQSIATVLDTATKTTLIVFTAPPPPTGPPPPVVLI